MISSFAFLFRNEKYVKGKKAVSPDLIPLHDMDQQGGEHTINRGGTKKLSRAVADLVYVLLHRCVCFILICCTGSAPSTSGTHTGGVQ